MNKQELIEKLKELQKTSLIDPELAHIKADNLLLNFIDDDEVEKEFFKIKKRYA